MVPWRVYFLSSFSGAALAAWALWPELSWLPLVIVGTGLAAGYLLVYWRAWLHRRWRSSWEQQKATDALGDDRDGAKRRRSTISYVGWGAARVTGRTSRPPDGPGPPAALQKSALVTGMVTSVVGMATGVVGVVIAWIASGGN